MNIARKFFYAVRNPKKALQVISLILKSLFRKKKGVLFFIGMAPDGEFNYIHRGYKKCYVFEANPERYALIEKKFKNKKRISIFNVAVADHEGEITFNISSNNNGASSSIGEFNSEWQKKYKGDEIRMIKKIKVRCINLNSFCSENGINYIDDYISDIQGMDLQVLKTIKPLIDSRKIGSIKCEVAKDDKKNIYSNLPDNSESGFNKLLGKNYKMIAKGSGLLAADRIEKIPEDSWEMDCKWKVIDN